MIYNWLYGIERNRRELEIMQILERTQLECFDNIHNHFIPKVTSQYSKIFK